MSQSAAKLFPKVFETSKRLRRLKVQRLSRKGVGASASKRGATIKVVDDIV